MKIKNLGPLLSNYSGIPLWNILIFGCFFLVTIIIAQAITFNVNSVFGKSPKASFSWKVQSPAYNGIISFIDQSKNEPTFWRWDFGDGQSSSERNPVHSYKKSGVYKVSLIVSNQFGVSKTTKFIFVLVKQARPTIFYNDRLIDWSRAGVWENGKKGIPERNQVFCNVRQNIPGSSLIAYGDGIHDDTAALQAAINLCPENQVVYVPEGKYKIYGRLVINKGITLRGEIDAYKNPVTEIIQALSLDSRQGTIELNGQNSYPFSTIADVIQGYNRGSNEIEVSQISNFEVNEIVTMDELNNSDLVSNLGRLGNSGDLNQCNYAGRIPGGTRAYGETFLVKNISGNKIIPNRPLYWNFQKELQPQVYVHSSKPLYYAGVENIHLRAVPSVSDGSGIVLDSCAYCWVENCEIESFPRRGIWLRSGCYGCEIRHNYIHNMPNDINFLPDRRYGIFILGNCSDNLIEDNIIYFVLSGIVLEVGNCGNVIAYNYINTTCYNFTSWKTSDILTHAPHNYMNLFEGNVAGVAEFDIYWGSSSHQMVFRNWFHTKNPDWPVNQNRIALTIGGWNRYQSCIGNVLGYPGMTEAETYQIFYEQIPFLTNYETVHLWKVGFWSGATGTAESNGDKTTVDTIIRHGNYDFVRNQTEWNISIENKNLQFSLYLKTKPSWFGSLNWPAIGPDVSPVNGKIPAQWRFENKLFFKNPD